MATAKKTIKKAARKVVAKSAPKPKVKSGVFWPMKGEELEVFKLFYPKGPTQDLYRTLFEDLFIRAQNRLLELKTELTKMEDGLISGKEQKRHAEIQSRKEALKMKLDLMTAEEELLTKAGEERQKLMAEIKAKRSDLVKIKGKHKASILSKAAHARLLGEMELLTIFVHGRK